MGYMSAGSKKRRMCAWQVAKRHREGGLPMKRNARYASATVALVLPAILAWWFAQYLIDTFFPSVTLVDLGVFYAMGLISGLATAISVGLTRRSEGDK
jgi:hypothetical protein